MVGSGLWQTVRGWPTYKKPLEGDGEFYLVSFRNYLAEIVWGCPHLPAVLTTPRRATDKRVFSARKIRNYLGGYSP